MKKKVTYKFEIGDCVWLKNIQEKGYVADFLNMNMLNISLQDHSSVPVFTSDIEIYKNQDNNEDHESMEINTVEIMNEAELSFMKYGSEVATGFYLSFLPVLENNKIHFFEMILVNDTNDDISFECKLKLNDELYMHLKNKLNRRYLYNLGDLAFDELNEKPEIIIDIEHSGNSFLKLNKSFKLKPKTFFKDISATPILNQSSYNYKLGFLTETNLLENKVIVVSRSLTHIIEKKIKENKFVNHEPKHKHYFVPDEIDLHIENLVDSYKGMSNADIIKIQLHHFRKAFELALINKLPKFTVVHGIGKGKLKYEIELIIKEYNAVRSFKNEYHYKFGFGATEIFFK